MVGKTLGDIGKANKYNFWHNEDAKKDIIVDAININVLVDEN
jgi:hypothetical protein